METDIDATAAAPSSCSAAVCCLTPLCVIKQQLDRQQARSLRNKCSSNPGAAAVARDHIIPVASYSSGNSSKSTIYCTSVCQCSTQLDSYCIALMLQDGLWMPLAAQAPTMCELAVPIREQ